MSNTMNYIYYMINKSMLINQINLLKEDLYPQCEVDNEINVQTKNPNDHTI